MNETSTTPAIELIRLTKRFRSRTGPTVVAVDDIDVTIGRGEVVALLGANGAGKTTTLDLVLGLTRPTEGSVRVLGREPRDAVTAGAVSAVLQSGGLLRDLTVRETVELVASMCREPRPVDEVLEKAGVTAIADRPVSKCSGGEQQRLRFALALLSDPDLLILDEPTAGMDVAARHDFWSTMHADAAAGRTVVFATHYLEEAETFAERIVLMAGGGVVADGSTAEIRARAAGRALAASLPDVRRAAEALRARPDVLSVDVRGDRVAIVAGDSDAVARALLLEHGARDLEIAAASLETAILTITHDEPALEVAR